MRKLLAAAAAALVTAVPAGAGGFATVGVAPLPSGDSTLWTPTLTVRAHGVTPVDGHPPAITIRNDETGEALTFAAAPTGTTGEYAARVEFPGPGVWSYEIRDGYAGQVHTFKPVEIAAPGDGGSALPLSLPWAAGAAAALLAALAALGLLSRRLRSAAAPATAPH